MYYLNRAQRSRSWIKVAFTVGNHYPGATDVLSANLATPGSPKVWFSSCIATKAWQIRFAMSYRKLSDINNTSVWLRWSSSISVPEAKIYKKPVLNLTLALGRWSHIYYKLASVNHLTRCLLVADHYNELLFIWTFWACTWSRLWYPSCSSF